MMLAMAFEAVAQEREVAIGCEWGTLCGTLTQSGDATDTALLIIAGSGPTDRNGNSSLNLNTYCYMMLAHELAKCGFDVLRYDKRGVAESHAEQSHIEAVVLDDFVDDALKCVDFLHNEGYQHVVVVGHSEGSNIALQMCLREGAKIDGVVLLCAAGYPLDVILGRQLSAQLMPSYIGLMVSATNIIQSLKRGEMVPDESVPHELQSLFHSSVQPFLIDSMQDDPVALIAQCPCPQLIITGGHDIQITPDNGERLLEASPTARWRNFEAMTHVLKPGTTKDRVEQLVSVYTNAQLPLEEGLVEEIANFVNETVIDK